VVTPTYLRRLGGLPQHIYFGHSLWAGAATSARAVGYALDTIAKLMRMRNKSTTTVSAHYVDSQAELDDACREPYDCFVAARL